MIPRHDGKMLWKMHGSMRTMTTARSAAIILMTRIPASSEHSTCTHTHTHTHTQTKLGISGAIALHNVCLVRMHVVGKDLQTLKPTLTQLVFGEHARNGAPKNLFRFGLHHGFEGDLLETTRVHSVMTVQLFLSLLPSHSDVLGIRHDHIVTHVS